MIITVTAVVALFSLVTLKLYGLIVAILAGWVFYDRQKRKHKSKIKWALLTLLLGPLVPAFYIPKRNLKLGEQREGGYWWNLAKSFSLFWTLLMLFLGISYLGFISTSMHDMTNDYELAGAGIGTALGMGMLFSTWFGGIIIALVLGLLLKKSVIEEGPTGELLAKSEYA